jgi:hypothetical protein
METPMQPSDGVRDAMLRFMDRLSSSDVASFDSIVSSDPAALVIGTAPGEWVVERDRMRFGFEVEGVTMRPGERPMGWELGDAGWFVDEPTMTYPDGSSIRTRLSSFFQREDGAWKLVHMHVSVGVPDDEVIELQARWLA